MKYNLKEIMEYAWAWFKNDDVEMDQIEYADYTMEKTFANCLKASWTRAKELAEFDKKQEKNIASSEELKAYNWAAKKLNFVSELTDRVKVKAIEDIKKVNFDMSVWKAAIVAIELSIENNK